MHLYFLNNQQNMEKQTEFTKKRCGGAASQPVETRVSQLESSPSQEWKHVSKTYLSLHDWSPNSSLKLSGNCILLVQLLAWHEVSWLEAKFHAPEVAIGSALMRKEEMNTEKQAMVHYSNFKQCSPESYTLEEEGSCWRKCDFRVQCLPFVNSITMDEH